MKRLLNTTIAVLIITGIALNVQAQDVKIGLQSAVTYQTLDQSNDDESLPGLASGFQTALGNLTGDFGIYDGGRAHVGLFISSKHHTEMWGYEGYFEMEKLPEWMKLGSVGEFFDNHLKVKAGHMTLDFGDGILYRSINGDVYNNELIGNPVPSPALTALGLETTINYGMANLLLGVSNGTTKGDLNEGHGTALHAKTWITPMEGIFRLAASVYTVDHSGNGTGYPVGGTKSYLYGFGDRAGGQYNIWNGPDGGELQFGKGQKETAFQFDGRVDLGKILVYGAVGTFRDQDTNGTVEGEDNGNPEERWNYFMGTARYNLTDWVYVAGRYSRAKCTMLASEDANGVVKRFQLGAGFHLVDGVLLKAEYVKQTTGDFGPSSLNNGVDLSLNPEFSGLVVQAAVSI